MIYDIWETISLLRKLEWRGNRLIGGSALMPCCPCCLAPEELEEHRNGCELAEALAEHEDE